MARQPRFVLPGQAQHIIQRGNNQSIIFAAEEDYQFYLEKLQDACKRFKCKCHAYVLMNNHIHLLLTPKTEHGIGKLMQSLGRYYVQYFNIKYGRTGSLWEGRYRAAPIEGKHYLLFCYRYIELNPVRADLVTHPSKYQWSSYHYNAMGRSDDILSPHAQYLRLGLDKSERHKSYRKLFRQHLSKKILQEIRNATNKGWVLGSDRYKRKIEKLTQRQASPKSRGGDRRSKAFRMDRK
ncbi:transposase [Candidatus Riflebacteria bacterium]